MIRISRYMYISHLLTLMVTRELAVCFDQYKLITCIYFTISVIINPLCLAPKVMVKKKIHFNFSNLYSCERVLILFFGLPDLLWSFKILSSLLPYFNFTLQLYRLCTKFWSGRKGNTGNIEGVILFTTMHAEQQQRLTDKLNINH